MLKEYLKIISSAFYDIIPRDSVTYRLLTIYKASGREKQKKALLTVIGIAFCGLLLFAYVFGFGSIIRGLFGPLSFVTYIFTVIVYILTFIMMCRTKARGIVAGMDNFTGRSTLENGAYGSSKWMSQSRAEEVFKISNISETNSIIYGQIPDTKPGTAVISNKPSSDGSVKESNTIVFGSPGKGKSVAKVIPDVLQCMKQGTSFAVTDPKGEIRQETIDLIRRPKEDGGFGFKAFTFNTKDPNLSNGWNALAEVINPETGRLDAIRLNLWVKIYFDNTAGPGEQKYFRDGSEDLMKVLISVITTRRENFIADMLDTMYRKVGGTNKHNVNDLKTISLKRLEYDVLEMAVKNGCDMELVTERIKEIYEDAPKVSIDVLCALEPKIDSLVTEINNLPGDHPGKIAWANLSTLKIGNVSAWTGMTSGLHNRLNLFVDRNLRMMLSHDEIDLHTITEKPTGLYIITKDGDSTYSPVLSLFFTFLIMDTKEEFDKQSEMDANWVNTKTPLQVILDEMYSIGVIGGKSVPGQPAWLASQLATVRSRHINMTMIFQSWTQLVELYGDMPSSSIINCCSNLMFLGGNDLKSLEFLSKYTGETSVVNESYSESSSILFGNKRSDDTRISTAKVALLTPDELRRMPERHLVLFHSGEHPIRLATFYYKDDPITKLLKPVNIRGDITPISERMNKGDIAQTAFLDANIEKGHPDVAQNVRNQILSDKYSDVDVAVLPLNEQKEQNTDNSVNTTNDGENDKAKNKFKKNTNNSEKDGDQQTPVQLGFGESDDLTETPITAIQQKKKGRTTLKTSDQTSRKPNRTI